MSTLSNWVGTTPTPQIIDTVTYDLYESSNPFRKRFTEKDITNSSFRMLANTSTSVGAEIFSVFANPYYISHKITKIPLAYNSVVSAYQKYSAPHDN